MAKPDGLLRKMIERYWEEVNPATAAGIFGFISSEPEASQIFEDENVFEVIKSYYLPNLIEKISDLYYIIWDSEKVRDAVVFLGNEKVRRLMKKIERKGWEDLAEVLFELMFSEVYVGAEVTEKAAEILTSSEFSSPYIFKQTFRDLRRIWGFYREVEDIIDLESMRESPDMFPLFISAVANLNEEDAKFWLRTIKEIEKKRPREGFLLFSYSKFVQDIFGRYSASVINHLIKTKSVRIVQDIYSVLQASSYEEKEKIMEKIRRSLEKFDIENPGKKKIIKMTKMAKLLAFSEVLGVDVCVGGKDLSEEYKKVENEIKNHIEKEYGSKDEDFVKRIFHYLPFIASKSKAVEKVLRGESVKKFGKEGKYPLQIEDFSAEKVREELEKYALKVGVTLGEIKTMKDAEREAEKIIRWGMIKKVPVEEISEIGRYRDYISKRTRKYFLRISPRDLEVQMEALYRIKSCLSPLGGRFNYADSYLLNPNTAFAVIEDENGEIWGRVTIFYGEDEKGQKVLARVSKIYSNAPVSEESVDEALAKYAKEIGAKFVRGGRIMVEGLNDVYDDYARMEGGWIVVERK